MSKHMRGSSKKGWEGNMYNGHNGGYMGHSGNYASKKDNAWDTGDAARECTHCDFVPGKVGYQIAIEHQVMGAVFGLCEQIKDEWQMLLIGKEEGKRLLISGYYVPKQEVTGATVRNLDVIDPEFIAQKGIVATIHSHSNMGVFFSTTDEQFTNMSLIRHHIVVNNRHDFVAKSRIDLPCGMVKFQDSSVHITTQVASDVVGFENIVKKGPVIYTPSHTRELDSGFYKKDKEVVVPSYLDVHAIKSNEGKMTYWDWQWSEISEETYNIRLKLGKDVDEKVRGNGWDRNGEVGGEYWGMDY